MSTLFDKILLFIQASLEALIINAVPKTGKINANHPGYCIGLLTNTNPDNKRIKPINDWEFLRNWLLELLFSIRYVLSLLFKKISKYAPKDPTNNSQALR